MENQVPKSIEIELPQDKAEGVYSNFVVIAYSPSEIVIDFARIMPGVPKARVQVRVIMTPQNAKMFLKTLENQLKKYEEQFGEIKLPGPGEEGHRKIGFP